MNTTQKVAEIRKELKSTFPKFKFSIVKNDYNAMSVYILSAPYQMTEQNYEQVNEYYIEQHYDGQKRNDLLKIKEIMTRDVSYRETGDYGTQPDFYTYINIGKWDRPFQLN